jgi:predicted aspartyl protease
VNQPYSQSYMPPAAVIEIRLAAPGTAQTAGPFPALIDTGADASLVPKSILLSLGAPSLFEAHLRSPWGELHAVVMHLADVLIGSERFPAIELAANESDDEFILGRNVLNKLPLFIDGPQQVTQLLSEPALQHLRAARTNL